MNKKIKLLCCLLLTGLSFVCEANAALAQCQGSVSRPPNLPPKEKQLAYIPGEDKLKIRTIVTVIHKDGTPEEEKVDQTIPFKWSDWLIKGYTLDQAILAAAGQYLKQVMNNMCIKHGCFKTP